MERFKKIRIIDAIQFFLILCIGIWGYFVMRCNESVSNSLEHLQEDKMIYQKIYQDQSIKKLQDRNNELYDSLQLFKDIVSKKRYKK